MEYGCQTISTKIYPLLKEHIFPNLNLNFKDEYAPAKELYNHLGLKYNSIDANGKIEISYFKESQIILKEYQTI